MKIHFESQDSNRNFVLLEMRKTEMIGNDAPRHDLIVKIQVLAHEIERQRITINNLTNALNSLNMEYDAMKREKQRIWTYIVEKIGQL